MKRSEVRQFVKSAVNELSVSVQFNSGRLTEFNSTLNKGFPYVWLEPLQASPALIANNFQPIDTWTAIIHIAKLDKADSTEDQYEGIVDECDYLAQRLTNIINNNLEDSKDITLSAISRVPFIKKHADCLTGVILTLTLVIPDRTDVC